MWDVGKGSLAGETRGGCLVRLLQVDGEVDGEIAACGDDAQWLPWLPGQWRRVSVGAWGRTYAVECRRIRIGMASSEPHGPSPKSSSYARLSPEWLHVLQDKGAAHPNRKIHTYNLTPEHTSSEHTSTTPTTAARAHEI